MKAAHTLYGLPDYQKAADDAAREFVAYTDRELEEVDAKSAIADLMRRVYELDFLTLRSVVMEQIFRHVSRKELLLICANYLDSETERRVSQRRKELAKLGAKAKLALDPKQIAKAEAHKLWKDRHAGMHPKLRTNEQFATECMHRWPELTSSKVITGWCTKWTKETKRQTTPAC